MHVQKRNKLAILVTTLLLLSIPTIYACMNPILYNEYGVPVPIFGRGITTIDASEYPSTVSILQYNLTAKNTNNQTFILTLTPSDDLEGYVYGLNRTFSSNEVKNITIPVYINGQNKTGSVIVSGICEDGRPAVVGSMQMRIIGRGEEDQNPIMNRVWVYVVALLVIALLLIGLTKYLKSK